MVDPSGGDLPDVFPSQEFRVQWLVDLNGTWRGVESLLHVGTLGVRITQVVLATPSQATGKIGGVAQKEIGSWQYTAVHEWGCSETHLLLACKGANMTKPKDYILKTPQAAEIVSLLKQHVVVSRLLLAVATLVQAHRPAVPAPWLRSVRSRPVATPLSACVCMHTPAHRRRGGGVGAGGQVAVVDALPEESLRERLVLMAQELEQMSIQRLELSAIKTALLAAHRSSANTQRDNAERR
jgi:hypothetical protein